MTLQYLIIIIISIRKVREGTAPFYESENEIRETGRTVTRGEKEGRHQNREGPFMWADIGSWREICV